MDVERMSPLDTSFLHIEDGVSHMHIASVGIFEGPEPPFQDIVAMIEGKLPLVPRYRQIVRTVPLELGRAVWVDDPHFNIDYHLRHTALPSPGGEAELRKLVGRVMSQQLDRSKPLWEIWVVEGLEDGRWAMVSKVHHAMVDGISGTDLLAVTMDITPTTPTPRSCPGNRENRRRDESWQSRPWPDWPAVPTSRFAPSGPPPGCPARRWAAPGRWSPGCRPWAG
jgi:diacylglycerol O-acyltransferase